MTRPTPRESRTGTSGLRAPFEQVRVDRLVVGLDEHRLLVAQQLGVVGEERPVVTHEGPALAPHQLGHGAGLAGPSGGRQRDRLAVVGDGRRVDHGRTAVDHRPVEHGHERGQQLTGAVDAVLVLLQDHLHPLADEAHRGLGVGQLVLQQRGVGHRFRLLADHDVRRHLAVRGEAGEHGLQLRRAGGPGRDLMPTLPWTSKFSQPEAGIWVPCMVFSGVVAECWFDGCVRWRWRSHRR